MTDSGSKHLKHLAANAVQSSCLIQIQTPEQLQNLFFFNPLKCKFTIHGQHGELMVSTILSAPDIPLQDEKYLLNSLVTLWQSGSLPLGV